MSRTSFTQPTVRAVTLVAETGIAVAIAADDPADASVRLTAECVMNARSMVSGTPELMTLQEAAAVLHETIPSQHFAPKYGPRAFRGD